MFHPKGILLKHPLARQMMMQKAFYDGWVDAAARAAGSAMPCHG